MYTHPIIININAVLLTIIINILYTVLMIINTINRSHRRNRSWNLPQQLTSVDDNVSNVSSEIDDLSEKVDILQVCCNMIKKI